MNGMTRTVGSRLAWLDERIASAVGAFCVMLLLAITVDILFQIVGRYVLASHVPVWTLQFSLLLMVWMVMLGGALGVREGAHVAVMFGVQCFPQAIRSTVYRIAWIGVAVFAGFLVWEGIAMVHLTMAETFATMDVPVGWMYLCVPISGVLMILYALVNALQADVPDNYTQQSEVGWLGLTIVSLLVIAVLGCGVAILGVDNVIGPVGVLAGSFIVLLALSTPVAFALGIASLITALWMGTPALLVAQRMVGGIDSSPLLAIPFFILAGQIMAEGGIAPRLVDFARVLVGPIPGGLAMVNIVTAMLFGGISGSAVADVSATGSILIPTMRKQGYDDDYSVAVTVAGSTQGIIIPPSQNAIIYSLAAGGVSIGGLFLAGYLPGLLIAVSLMVVAGVIAVRRGYPPVPRPPARECLKICITVLPGLGVGLFIVGGIVFGIFTATESGAIGVALALLISALVYRDLTWRKLWRIGRQSVRVISMVLLLIATASAFGWFMAFLSIPGDLATGLTRLSHSGAVQLFLIDMLVLILGAVMDMAPLILILTPVLLPIVQSPPINMDPVQFGILLLMNLAIGLTTPPVGTALFVGCGIGKTSLEKASRSMLLFWPPLIVVLFLITYFPKFVTFLPNLFGM